HFIVDADYFHKLTRNAYDFSALLNTPITFPISWDKSKLDGVSVRVDFTNYKGLSAFMTAGHTRARFFPPETAGLFFHSDLPTGRDGERRHKPAAHRPAPPLRPERRNRQPPAHRAHEDDASVHGHQPDEQEGALQLPLDLQRHALRQPAHLPGSGRRHVLKLRTGQYRLLQAGGTDLLIQSTLCACDGELPSRKLL